MVQEDIKFRNDVPDDKFLLPYVLLVLDELGGKATVREVYKGVEKMLDISDELLNEKTDSGQEAKFTNRIRFARLSLKVTGYIVDDKSWWGRGSYELSQKGKDVIEKISSRDETILNKFRNDTHKLRNEIRKGGMDIDLTTVVKNPPNIKESDAITEKPQRQYNPSFVKRFFINMVILIVMVVLVALMT